MIQSRKTRRDRRKIRNSSRDLSRSKTGRARKGSKPAAPEAGGQRKAGQQAREPSSLELDELVDLELQLQPLQSNMRPALCRWREFRLQEQKTTVSGKGK